MFLETQHRAIMSVFLRAESVAEYVILIARFISLHLHTDNYSSSKGLWLCTYSQYLFYIYTFDMIWYYIIYPHHCCVLFYSSAGVAGSAKKGFFNNPVYNKTIPSLHARDYDTLIRSIHYREMNAEAEKETERVHREEQKVAMQKAEALAAKQKKSINEHKH